jgi:hypothetical protein
LLVKIRARAVAAIGDAVFSRSCAPLSSSVISFAFAASLGETQITATGSRAHRVRARKEDTIAEQTKPFPGGTTNHATPESKTSSRPRAAC